MGPTIVIRADASSRIGTGHVMRCLALAASAKKQGWQISLIGFVASNELQSRVADMGIHFTPLENACPDSVDLEKTLKLLACHSENGESRPYPPWLVLDGYQFDASYHEAVRGAGVRLLVVDDYNHLERYDCDILLNQNIGAERLDYQTATDTRRLLGPRFALLRPEFLPWKDKKTEVPEKARRILVTMGGADPDNATSKILEGLSLVGDTKIEVKVVVGPANPRLSEIEQIMAQAPFPGEVLFGVQDMASIMAWADVAVTSASVTSLELAFIGVPMLAAVLAENQKGLAAGLAQSGAAVNLGSSEDLAAQKICRAVSDLFADRLSRQAMSDAGRGLVDGRGADRILAVFGQDLLNLRAARPMDCRRLWEWANDPVARSHSFNTDFISWEEHQVWFNARLNDSESCIYLAELQGGVPVGTVRFQTKDEHAVVSVTIDDDFRGLGIGVEVIRNGCRKYRQLHPGRPIHALIKPGNPASQYAFTKAGFKPSSETNYDGVQAIVMVYWVEGR